MKIEKYLVGERGFKHHIPSDRAYPDGTKERNSSWMPKTQALIRINKTTNKTINIIIYDPEKTFRNVISFSNLIQNSLLYQKFIGGFSIETKTKIRYLIICCFVRNITCLSRSGLHAIYDRIIRTSRTWHIHGFHLLLYATRSED